MATAMKSAKKSMSYTATESEVRAVKTPRRTASWNPMGHGKILDMVLDLAGQQGFKFEKGGRFSMSNDGARMLATFKLTSTSKDDYGVAFGVRNSIDKSMPAAIILGAEVFVCSNGMFSAEFGTSGKHCANVEEYLPIRIMEALKRFMVGRVKQDDLIVKMKRHAISIPTASDFIIRTAAAGIIPSQAITRIYGECVKPRFAEFAGPEAGTQTLWGMYNAITTVLRHDRREINPMREQNMLLQVHQNVVSEFQTSLN